MKSFNKKLLQIAVLTACSVTTLSSFATETILPQKVAGFYVGGGWGNSKTSGATNIAERGKAYKAIVGYQFNRVIGIESQYTKYDEVSLKIDRANLKWSPESASFGLNLGYTLENDVRPFAVIGASYIRSGASSNNDIDLSAALRLGVGVEFSPVELGGLSFRAAWETDRFKAYKKDKKLGGSTYGMSNAYLGMLYKF